MPSCRRRGRVLHNGAAARVEVAARGVGSVAGAARASTCPLPSPAPAAIAAVSTLALTPPCACLRARAFGRRYRGVRARESERVATGHGLGVPGRRCSAPTRALTLALVARPLRILPRDSLVTAGAPVPCMCAGPCPWQRRAPRCGGVDALLWRGYSSGHSGAGGRRGRVAARVARGGGGAEGARLFICLGVAVAKWSRMMRELRES